MESDRVAPEADYAILPRHSACLTCRRRKQKCDAVKPQCSECVNGGRSCRFEDETYKTRTQILQDRIRELEAQIKAIEGDQDTSFPSIPSSQYSFDVSKGISFGSPSGSNLSHPSAPGIGGGSVTDSAPKSTTSQSLRRSSLGITPATMADSSWPAPAATKKLLDLFFVRHAQCGFELHLGRVMNSLQPGAPEPMIPALFNAMLLMACHFTQDDSSKLWENAFLQRTKTEIEINIDRAHGIGKDKYNPLYHLQAMLMLGIYYYFKGRLLEGHLHVTNATQFAVSLGLHQLNSRIYRQDREETIIKAGGIFGAERWHPKDSVQLGEAINVWWSCSCWDMSGSTLSGLLPVVLFEGVTTVWPRPLSDFESDNPLPDDNYSIASLLDPEVSHYAADVSGDSVDAIFAKATVLMQCAAKLDMERVSIPQGTEKWWTTFEQCDQALNRVTRTMPSIHSALNIEELARLVKAQTSIYCGHVQLHCALTEYELVLGAQGDPRCIQPDGSLGGLSYLRCLEACHATSLTAAFVANIDLSYMNMFIGISWVCVAEVVARDVPRLAQAGRITEAREKEEQAGTIEKCMEKLVATYPVLGLQVDQLRTVRRDHLARLGQAK